MSNKHDVDYTESFTRTLIITMILMVVGIFATKQINTIYKSRNVEQKQTKSMNTEIKSNE